ncbi:LysE family transporter [Kiloniella sp. b19]|uniref:LysE family transporter n=1 Tax=Kiloniella sp. GXU_MW_B19 TaxID=3141326 RepID=UPI0031E2C394
MDVLLKGIAVGVAIAAPVGPIGLLCIRTTLMQGRVAGLATGLGAASADALYGLMVAAGLTLTGILVAYALPLKLFGGLLIAVLGGLTVRSFFRGGGETDPEASRSLSSGGSVFKAYGVTFVLTLSNPMTIIAFVGMVSALGSTATADGEGAYLLVAGVFFGSALWWLFMVHLSLFARKRLPVERLRFVELFSGLILLVWGGWIAGEAFFELF